MREAKAAPEAPHKGINIAFKEIFKITAGIYKYLIYFCFSLHTNQAFLATPK
jgi:hypothetical protein